ncbi:hypothetical protein [Dietzia sp.]|uniref:hypothetical protein n=1 Tax=Dietzia sp. TaxID=1871616 RepID=UPI002FD8992D
MRTFQRPAFAAIVGVAALAWIVRVVVTALGWFYWDDLSFLATTRAEDSPIPLLFRDHDGHIMPAAWLIEWALAHAAPLVWPAAVVVIAILQAVALAAVARAVWLVVTAIHDAGEAGAADSAQHGRGPDAPGRALSPWLAAVPVAVYGFSPLALPGGTWLAAAVNALPLHAAFALAVAYIVCALVRAGSAEGKAGVTGALRHGILAAGLMLVGLLFSERALFVLPAAALVVLALALAGLVPWRGRAAWRRIAEAFGPLLGITVAWGVLYLLLTSSGGEPAPNQPSGQGTWDAFWNTYVDTLVPSFSGGPWTWGRWHPGPPFVDPSWIEIALGVGVSVAVLAWTGWAVRRSAMWLWLPLLVYPAIPALALALHRTSPLTAALVANTLRHLSEVAVVAALCAAAVAGVAARRGQRRAPDSAGRKPSAAAAGRKSTVLIGAVLAVVTVVSAVTHWGYARTWHEQPSREYFAALRDSTAELEGDTLLDQPVGLDVLLPVMGQDNMLSRLVGGLDGYPEIAHWTKTPRVVDGQGHLQPAEILQVRSIVQGFEPNCGMRISAGSGATSIPLDGPLVERDWTLQFNYFASGDGVVALSLGGGQPVEVPVTAGLGQATVQLVGDGEALRVEPGEGVGDMCVGGGPLGGLMPK